jgi:hypothetical protein
VAVLLLVSLLGLSLGAISESRDPTQEAQRNSLWLLVAQAAVAVAATVYLAFYLAGDDDYLDDGTSRWDSREEHEFAIAGLAAGTVVCVFALIAIYRRGRLVRAAGFAGAGAALTMAGAFAAHTFN